MKSRQFLRSFSPQNANRINGIGFYDAGQPWRLSGGVMPLACILLTSNWASDKVPN